MSKVKPRVMSVKPHRACDWNEKAIRAVIKERGFVLAGIKVDGMRCHVLKIDGEVHFLTRAGIEIPALAPYKAQFEQRWAELALADKVVLDCEVWLPSVSFEEGCGILRRDAPVAPGLVQFVVLDLITQDQLQGLPVDIAAAYVARHAGIVGRFTSVLGDAGTVLEPHHPLIVSEALAKIEDFDDIKNAYNVARDIGFEGLVIKDPALHPRNGKVSGMWKVKPGCGAEFAPGWEGDGKIVGYVWGDEGKANAGKIVGFRVALEDGTEVNATGLTQAQMDEYTGCVASSAGPYIGRYAEVTAMEKTASGSLRHPSFRRFRDLDSAPGVKA
ncbi:putative DNA endonuclease [Pseudomonas phage MR16]|nr:putative DNA endonuclease [Pseudomonas phage MR8]QJD55026.1 putative DNA endonuclease [Pseudomonas phage MR12]QJD55329.1 putative DNA endonuclease [Pseudomonas phage MR18]QJF74593.1 putative DNA endonuclease [Pseudomonas phage MR16]